MGTAKRPITANKILPDDFPSRQVGGDDATDHETGTNPYDSYDENAPYETLSTSSATERVGDDPPRPVVWQALTSDEAEFEWLRLNDWVEDLRRVFNLPATVVPPYWHRHPLLVEHLSALHTHWLAAYDPQQHGSAPFGWIRDLDEWRNRMREVVSELGCRINSCRPEQHTTWPGEPETDPEEFPPPLDLADRYQDFVTLVMWDVERRRDAEDRYFKMIADLGLETDTNGRE